MLLLKRIKEDKFKNNPDYLNSQNFSMVFDQWNNAFIYHHLDDLSDSTNHCLFSYFQIFQEIFTHEYFEITVK